MDPPQPAYHCFGVRRLNPFRGVIQICAGREARALSADGHHWEIQILTRRPDDMWGAPPPGEPASQFIRFGVWSPDAGLRQVPANPLLDLAAMLPLCQALTGELEQAVRRLPFPLTDRYELWLPDAVDGRPLALLASSSDPERLLPPDPLRWQADRARALRETPGSSSPRPPDERLARLERLVADSAGGRGPVWFRRSDDGGGRPLAGSGGPQEPVAAEAFPPLLLRDRWEDPAHQRLVDDYLEWRAAELLTLPGLDPGLRQRLERQARADAVAVARLWRLYPVIVDQQQIRAARVEARLRSR
ncbi:MAG TPA: hypothetical protein ENI96_12545 [Sedimenticola thiotaurini]|uniref:Uncharacterized protein n=1 Tax=Sedimenticola thiotaurini TaxID=1543721 RepID=A0A831RKU6_9GAMM|nr:hypothetical protein [Sedimenticola thiotaurini]